MISDGKGVIFVFCQRLVPDRKRNVTPFDLDTSVFGIQDRG